MVNRDRCNKCKHKTTHASEEPCVSCKHIIPEYDTTLDLYEPVDNNKVDHPMHYNRSDAMECIDEMMLVFGKEATMKFCLLNAWKYRYRAADKNGVEDLKKSDWYLQKYKELKGVVEHDT